MCSTLEGSSRAEVEREEGNLNGQCIILLPGGVSGGGCFVVRAGPWLMLLSALTLEL